MTANIKAAQARLMAAGFPMPKFGADGDFGNETFSAFNAAMDELERLRPAVAPAPVAMSRLVPAEWMPVCTMKRIICHWTAGPHKATATDKEHYHIIIQGDGTLVRGDRAIADNVSTTDGKYAAHTLNCNAGSIGVSLACMAGAVEQPFKAGTAPMTAVQWNALTQVVAELATRYDIPVGPATVLSHAEVQGTLGIQQRGKWDYTRLAFDPTVVGAAACGDKLRREVRARLL